MTAERAPLRQPSRPPGCLRRLPGLAAVVVLAPLAAVVRGVRAWRRGAEVRVERTRARIDDRGDGALVRIDCVADVPGGAVERFRRRLTDTVIRVAETMRRPDDVYHVLYRDRAADETVVLPVGPQLQELGERLHLTLTDGAMTGRTAVWLTLARSRRLVEILDPFGYDPESEGEPERLLVRAGIRWGMATAFTFRGPSVLFRIVIYVPEEASGAVGELLDRLGS